jgi:hypothetical protein
VVTKLHVKVTFRPLRKLSLPKELLGYMGLVSVQVIVVNILHMRFEVLTALNVSMVVF